AQAAARRRGAHPLEPPGAVLRRDRAGAHRAHRGARGRAGGGAHARSAARPPQRARFSRADGEGAGDRARDVRLRPLRARGVGAGRDALGAAPHQVAARRDRAGEAVVRTSLVALALLLAGGGARAAGTFADAQRAYVERDYDAAIARYEALAAAGQAPADVYYQLRHAYFRSGQARAPRRPGRAGAAFRPA